LKVEKSNSFSFILISIEMTDQVVEEPVTKRVKTEDNETAPVAAAAAPAVAAATAAPIKKPNPATGALQQQIQAQLQQQLQAQLQAAAARGQQANITPEQIQAQAQVCELHNNPFYNILCTS
jgi:hypothetical protein